MIIRDVSLDDVPELTTLIDAQESSVDPRHKPASHAWAADLIRGHFETTRNQVWCDENGRILAWASMQPDDHRERIEIELFRQPGFASLSDVWAWCLDVAERDFPGWVIWPTANHLDPELAEVFGTTGFQPLRRYHLLTRPLENEQFPALPVGYSIDSVRSDADFAEWHAAHQDSFSQHFGFTPRPAEQWITHFREGESIDAEGRFLLRVDGRVAGFVICTDFNAHENGGYVDLLGVRHEFQGRGLGELLLRWAFAHSAKRGFTAIDLSVDTGNTSGALQLYTKLGFTIMSEFHLYARP